MAYSNLSKANERKKGVDGNAVVLAAGTHLAQNYIQGQLNKEIVRSYKTRIDSLVQD